MRGGPTEPSPSSLTRLDPAGDTLSFGASAWVRKRTGSDGYVKQDPVLYGAGVAGGTALSMMAGNWAGLPACQARLAAANMLRMGYSAGKTRAAFAAVRAYVWVGDGVAAAEAAHKLVTNPDEFGVMDGLSFLPVATAASRWGHGWLTGKMCFVAGTKVLAWDAENKAAAWKDIKDIAAGDWVWSRADDDSGREGWRPVEEKFVRFGRVLWLTLSGQRLGTTGEHPFWLEGRGWTEAGELQLGDRIRTLDGRSAVVEALEVSDAETVYNFRVAEYHTYFVGGAEWGFGVWVHNASYATAAPESRAVGERFRGRAEELWNTLPDRRRYGATVAVTEVNGREVVSLYANVGRGQRQFSQAQINSFRASVEDAGGVFVHTSGNVHAEQALHQAYGNAPAIGISNYNGPCPACSRYFQQQGYSNLFWPDRP